MTICARLCYSLRAMLSRLSATLLLLFWIELSAAAPAHAFWLWTSQKGKFERSGEAAEATAAGQFRWAQELFQKGDFEKAAQEFAKVAKRFPKSKEAMEALYFKGVSQEEMGDEYEAYQSYQEVVNRYPETQRVGEIVDRQFRIGNYFLTKEEKKVAGVTVPILPGLDRAKALEVFEHVSANAPYGAHAVEALSSIGHIHFDDEKYTLSIRAFEELVKDFPASEKAEEAEFMISNAAFRLAEQSGHDAAGMGAALDKLEGFLEKYPESKWKGEAEGLLLAVNEKMAEEEFNIAAFYEKQNYFSSAEVYYKNVSEKFPGTTWALMAEEKLKEIDAPLLKGGAQ